MTTFGHLVLRAVAEEGMDMTQMTQRPTATGQPKMLVINTQMRSGGSKINLKSKVGTIRISHFQVNIGTPFYSYLRISTLYFVDRYHRYAGKL